MEPLDKRFSSRHQAIESCCTSEIIPAAEVLVHGFGTRRFFDALECFVPNRDSGRWYGRRNVVTETFGPAAAFEDRLKFGNLTRIPTNFLIRGKGSPNRFRPQRYEGSG